MSDPQPAISELLDDEGGAYTPDDHGRGPCRWGINLQSAREFFPHATAQDIETLTRERAAAWYQRCRWERYRIGLLEDQAVATKVFNMLVNLGAGGWVSEQGQRVLKDGALTLLQKTLDLPADGILGPATAKAANAADRAALLARYRAVLVQHYEDILKAHPEWENDRAGWLARANR